MIKKAILNLSQRPKYSFKLVFNIFIFMINILQLQNFN